VTIPVVVISMAISVLAAYALSRLGFAGAGILGTAVFLVHLVPDSLLFIPLFKIIGSLGLLNSKWSLVLVYPTAINAVGPRSPPSFRGQGAGSSRIIPLRWGTCARTCAGLWPGRGLRGLRRRGSSSRRPGASPLASRQVSTRGVLRDLPDWPLPFTPSC
jgi:hypothetical protein